MRLRLHLDGRTAAGSTTRDRRGRAGGAGRAHDRGRRGSARRTRAGPASPRRRRWPRGGGDFDEATAQRHRDERAARVRDFVDAAGGLETAGYCRTVVLVRRRSPTPPGSPSQGRTAEAAMDGIARAGGRGRRGPAAPAAGSPTSTARCSAPGRPRRRGPAPIRSSCRRAATRWCSSRTRSPTCCRTWPCSGSTARRTPSGSRSPSSGAQQFDPAVTIVDDALGARCAAGCRSTPRAPRAGRLTLVEAGVTAAVTHDRRTAAEAGAVSTGHALGGRRARGARCRATCGWPPAGGRQRRQPAATVPDRRRGAAAGRRRRARAAGHRPLVHPGARPEEPGRHRADPQRRLADRGRRDHRGGAATCGSPSRTRRRSAPGAVLGIGGESVLLPDRWADVRFAAPALHLASWNLTGNASG